MNEKEAKRIDYQFVPVPTELVFALDPCCLKAMAVMIDRESYWKSRNKVFNGYFTLSVEELAEYLCLENRKDARLTLEALYRAGLIDVKAEAGKRIGAKVKINWEVIENGDLDSVEKLPRSESITYCIDKNCSTTGTTSNTFCTATLEIEQDKEIEKEIDKEQEVEQDKETHNIDYFVELFLNYNYHFDYYLLVNEQMLFYEKYQYSVDKLIANIERGTGIKLSVEATLNYLFEYLRITGRI